MAINVYEYGRGGKCVYKVSDAHIGMNYKNVKAERSGG